MNIKLDPVVPKGAALRDYVRCFDGALPRELCEKIIASFEAMTGRHVRHGKGIDRGLERSGWTELEITSFADEAFKAYFQAQVAKYLAVYNDELGLTIPVPDLGLHQNLRVKRYIAGSGESFQPHFDALGNQSHRYLVFLWYLNDVTEGGETVFCDLDISVSARAGRLLVFPPYWMFQHTGMPPHSGDKYILSTYLLFPLDAGARPLQRG